MRILFADTFPEQYLTQLTADGHDVDYQPALTAEDMPRVIPGAEVVVVRSTKVTAETINTSDQLALIIRAGAGTNNIDVKAAAVRGIFVCNTPGKNAIAVAEVTMGLMLAIDRLIPDNVMAMREQKWNKKRFSQTNGIFGRNLGIIGAGQIGMEVARRAHVFGMNLFIDEETQRWSTAEALKQLHSMGCTILNTRTELAEKCDVITLHVPETPETKCMINRAFLSHVQPNAIILNASRGSVIVDEDLIDAMNEKGIRCGLDVFNNEPSGSTGEINTPLSQHPNVYGTHHIGASTEQAQMAIAEETMTIIRDFEKGLIDHWVNLEKTLQKEPVISLRHNDRTGIFAEILTVLKKYNVDVEWMENKNFSGKIAVFTNIYSTSSISTGVILELQQIPDIIQVKSKQGKTAEKVSA